MNSEPKQHNLESIIELAKQNGIQVDAERAELNESGADFLAVVAADADGVTWVLRTPRRSDVLKRAAYESNVLKLVREYLPVNVPDWQVNTPELIAYPILEGTVIATIDMEIRDYVWQIDKEAPSELFVDSFAQALVALHGISHDAAAIAGVRVQQPREVRQTLIEQMEQAKREFGVADALWERWQNWLADDSYWPTHSALIHGDLHPGHILVDDSQRVTGLLDWTEGIVADPASDFSAYYATLGEEALVQLLERYERAGGRVWPRMREHIIELRAAFPALIAVFALQTGEEMYMEMAREALGVKTAEPVESSELSAAETDN
ncbi:macrolide 2'-phosphotransferase [Paenibacillus sp. 481]|uniref:macrolide 2'-phosphotransferase n=1 Tax=Paenibacillus sp. 481 TaxID=2835869 RepID=UPI001E3A7FBE|nr:macrolide 2'-phosphotransferase [Paenibacillus sp. 481]UHA76049.1 macrolide 2'-phosphotransferase [Paenibacillus sp. 481]